MFDCIVIYLKNKTTAPIARKIVSSAEVKSIIETLKGYSNNQKIKDTL